MLQETNKFNIGFTSIGRRVELVRAFKNAYSDLKLEGTIVGLDKDSMAPALRIVDRNYIVPPLQSSEYIPALVDICKTESIDILFPLIDPDIQRLGEHRRVLEETGVRLAVVGRKGAEIARDKRLTQQFFQDLSLKTPRTWQVNSLPTSDVPFPLFIKSSTGSAGKNAYRVENSRELSFFANYIPDAMIQECLPGPEITTDVTCDLESNVLAVVSRRRIEVRWGEVSKGVTIHDQRIEDACVKIAQHLPAAGPITVQCIMKNDEPYFTEINARFGGGLPLGIAAGVDSPKLLLGRLAGLPIEIPPLGQYRTGLYMTRYDESFFFTERDREEIQRRHF